jgi:hypothetical protein
LRGEAEDGEEVTPERLPLTFLVVVIRVFTLEGYCVFSYF